MAFSQSLCVKAASAVLRAEPKSSAAVTWTVGKYTPLLKLDKKSGWYKVQDMDGEIHWIQAQAVSSEIRCLSIRTSTTNVRTGAGKQFPLVDRPVADRYTGFKRLENEEEWYQVEDSQGAKGWVHESNIWRPTTMQNISF